MDHDHPNHGDMKILGDLLAGMQFTMLTTIAPDGTLVSRPLQTLQIDSEGALWFFTAADSGKLDDIRNDARVNLSYANPVQKIFVAVSGHARIVDDRKKIDELWSAAQTIFFPQGRDDPTLALLKIEPDSAKVWEGKESMLTTLLKFGRAVIQGEASDIGTSRELDVGPSL